MRKFFTPVSLLVLASLVLAACGAVNPTPQVVVVTATPEATSTPSGEEMMATVAEQFYATVTAQAAEGQVEEPAPTATQAPTGTPLPTETPVNGPQLRTAEQMRAFGRVIGWVTGGSAGEFVQGAQVALKEDFVLNTLPEGYVFEFECVQYSVLNAEVQAKVVCTGALIRFGTTSVVPAGSIGTLWLTHPVVGSETEQWAEGFLNAPCLCSDGDCRDE